MKSLASEFLKIPCGGFGVFGEYPPEFKQAAEQEEIALFKYDKENLLYWSDNSLPVGLEVLRTEPTNKLWHLKNGWYMPHRVTTDSCSVIAFALVKREFSYTNKYLNDYFKDAETVNPGALLSVENTKGSYALLDDAGNPIAFVRQPESVKEEDRNDLTDIAWFLSGAFLLAMYVHKRLKSGKSPLRNHVVFWIGLCTIRWISFFIDFPEILYSTVLFEPTDYASSYWLPTLGDLLLNSLLLFYPAFLLWKYGTNNRPAFKIKSVIPLFTGALGFAWLCVFLIQLLVIDSSIGFEINNISASSSSTYIAYFIIALLLSSTMLVMHALPVLKGNTARIVFILLLIIFMLPLATEQAVFVALAAGSSLLLISQISRWISGRDYGRIVLNLVVLSAVGTSILLYHTGKRELEKRKLLAQGISAERDPIAEQIFSEVEQKIKTDTLLKSYLRPGTVITGQVRDLAQLYFNGYWEKYKINVQIFGADECPLTSLYTRGGNDPSVFDRLIDSIGIPTQSSQFFFLNNNSGRISYMAKLDIKETNSDTVSLARLYIEFNSRYTPEEIGYPELLLDRKVRTNTDLSRYSYARYNTNKLVSHFGQFPYRLVDTDFNRLSNDSFLINRYDGYSHLAMRSGKDTLVVLSLPIPGMMQILTPFSYLTLLFTLLLCVGFIAGQRLDLSRMSFKRKIQSSIIAILFISLLLIGGGTILYIISNNTQKNQRNISEKIHSILVETELMLNRQEFLDPAKSDEIAYGLSRQANVFFSDINLFSPSGILFASSRTKLFDEGLISRKINPEAFYHLSVENTSEYIHSERIGQLEYISAYVPMRNAENKVIGYLNLPYFARQSELQREIASFVVAIVNIYVLLAVLVIIAAIFLSNSVTGPLRILQDRLASVKLGSKNEAIQWKSRDEIGALIDEYNGMLAELAASAEKLAKSERESAWREMAKQVAHEIKNPLTPMKLNTQMLKRAWEDKAPGFEERLNRYAQNLIEQIDTLSHIATEFGNFAQMPRMQKEEVDMRSLLQHVAEFHENQHCSIHFTNDGSKSYVVLTDKEQMLRAFNNLIRNAEQAIPDDRKGEIGLRLKRANDRVVIQVSDNGKGIPSELQERIFRPNFTTKTTGMGLGLALVKNIVESSDGQIHFETEVDRGTTFTLELPAV